MPYTLQLDDADALLEVRYQGVVTVAERFQAWSEARPLLERSGYRRILIDLTGARAGPDDSSDFSAFANRITSEPLLLASRTAFVVPAVHPVNHLIEVLADARHYPFQRFDTRAPAIEWLRRHPSPATSE
jgi:hypothetical protein